MPITNGCSTIWAHQKLQRHVRLNSSIPGESQIGSVKRSCRSSFIHQLIPWPICSCSEFCPAALEAAGTQDPVSGLVSADRRVIASGKTSCLGETWNPELPESPRGLRKHAGAKRTGAEARTSPGASTAEERNAGAGSPQTEPPHQLTGDKPKISQRFHQGYGRDDESEPVGEAS